MLWIGQISTLKNTQNYILLTILLISILQKISSVKLDERREKSLNILEKNIQILDAQSRGHNGTGIKWYTSEDCNRPCRDDEPPKHCYYYFRVEFHHTMSIHCRHCQSDSRNQLYNWPRCECIVADGVEKMVLTVNRMLPGPSIQVCLHDRLIIDVENTAEGIDTTIHWHGLLQRGTPYFDGVPYVTQCPILSGHVFRYQFEAKEPGTHYYHSHTAFHMMDGLFGSLIVREPLKSNPLAHLFDEDRPEDVLIINDWIHEFTNVRFIGIFDERSPNHDPVESILLNGRGRFKDPKSGNWTFDKLERFIVEPGKRYRFRVISTNAISCLVQISIDDHRLTVIAQDGYYVEPIKVDRLVLTTGERVDFILETKKKPNKDSYVIRVQAPIKCLVEAPSLPSHPLAIIQYSGVANKALKNDILSSNYKQKSAVYNYASTERCIENSHKEFCVQSLKSIEIVDPRILKVEPDYRIEMPFSFIIFNRSRDQLYQLEPHASYFLIRNGSSVASMIGNISHYNVPIPLLLEPDQYHETKCNVMSMPKDCKPPCSCFHHYHFKLNSVVEIIAWDEAPWELITHTFHLHGHAFHVFETGQFAKDKIISREKMMPIINDYKKKLREGRYNRVPKKDTIRAARGGYMIIRFLADNPGWWIFHCHLLWHQTTGMSAIFQVGETSDLPPIPENFPRCSHWTPAPIFN